MAQSLIPRTAPAPADEIVVLENVTWAEYQRQLELRGERPVPRVAFLEGTLELMSPSRPHEMIKSMIGCLVEAWCLEMDVAGHAVRLLAPRERSHGARAGAG